MRLNLSIAKDENVPIRKDLIQYLQYVKNTGGNANINQFDDDWEPIGPMLRAELIPTYIVEGPDRNLVLTEKGKEELANG
ncbi:MAG TPA: hypothetical protein VHK86_00190 [Nitrososphaera sp.]|nr:hypothetical protein [Nitrososphaera sp.]